MESTSKPLRRCGVTRPGFSLEWSSVAEKNESYMSAASTKNSGRASLREEATPFESSQSGARGQTKPKSISAEEFDRMFDDGEDISAYLDWSNARRPGLEPKRVNVDFPTWMVERLDRQARTLGVTRQALIKMWIAEKLEARD